MKVLRKIKLPAEGGRYEIYRNGVYTGIYRLQPHTADAEILQMKINEPSAEFDYRQVITVTAVGEFEEIELGSSDGTDELSADSQKVSVQTTE